MVFLFVGLVGSACAVLLHAWANDAAPDWQALNLKLLIPMMFGFAAIRWFTRNGASK
jgi:hypothetical protein